MNDQETVGLLTRTKHDVCEQHSANGTSLGEADTRTGDFGLPATAVETTAEALGPGAGAAVLFKQGIDWPVVVWICLVHAAALVAPFFFSWQALLVCAFLILLTGSAGVCMGYHRCLTHGSFKTYRPVRWLLAFLGGLSGEGSALTWVANHRKHHCFSDKKGDPHSPRNGAWWSHMLWFMPNFGRRWHHGLVEKYAPDIKKDKVMVVIHHLFLPSHIALGVGVVSGWLFRDGHRPGRLAGWVIAAVLGPGRADGVRAARDLDDQLGDAHVGHPPLRDDRRQPQFVVGWPAGLRRGLAQQSPCLSARRQPGPPLVGNRRDLLHDLDHGEGRAGVGRGATAGYPAGHEAGVAGVEQGVWSLIPLCSAALAEPAFFFWHCALGSLVPCQFAVAIRVARPGLPHDKGTSRIIVFGAAGAAECEF